MANNFPNLKRIAQINSYYCGPASLQMLLSFYDVNIDQQQVVDCLGINDKISTHGMTIQEMGQFIKKYYPQFQFWYKFNSTIPELSQLINQFHFPVGVEWQGIFDYPDEDSFEDEDDDPGHLAVITGINTGENYIYIADPDAHYAGTDRQFSILQFERRWWDINEINHQEIDDYHGLFLITPYDFSFPDNLELLKP
jgi:ABC-type bacteriocin/lantibiotic exporter with double-glycine peptidase domain